ncbi:hypothetical protein ACLB2K_050887 [Fragaria x ananassa]
MSQIPKLDNAPLNLKFMREQSRKEIINILKSIRGRKCLVVDLKLAGSISLIIQAALLREHEVELRHLSDETIQTDCSKVVFLVRSQLSLMKYISSQVHDDISKGMKREYHLYFVPCHAVSCEKECLVDGDTSSLWHVAKAIHMLEFSCGVIPNVRAKGNASVRVADILNRMQIEEPVSSSDMVVPEINTVILLDREVDMVTPMCTQLTYEGIVDEFLRINNGSVEVNPSVMDVKQEGQKMKVPLNSSDKLFKEIRDLHFEVVVQILRQKATSMKQDYNEPSFCGLLDMEQTIVETESFDMCSDYIEEMMLKREPLVNVLHLLILLSITNSGLPEKNFDYLRNELRITYGFGHRVTLKNMKKAGLFKVQEKKGYWPTVKRALQLVVEDTDTANPNDIDYVFSGYAPPSIHLVQHAI